MDASEPLYSDSKAFRASRRKRLFLMVLPIAVSTAVPLALLVLVSRQPIPAEGFPFVALAWGAWALGLAVAAMFPFLLQTTRVSATHIDPPLRPFLSALRRETRSIAIADVEKVERRKGTVRCYVFHLKGRMRRWPESIGEHNVEDFVRFSTALRRIFPDLDMR